NDCSIRAPGLGWAVTQTGQLYAATSTCELDPNSPCCRSCGQIEATPPAGCDPLLADAACAAPQLDAEADPLNLRCFDQKRRFGMDFLFPTARYAVGLTKTTLCPFSIYGDADCDCDAARAADPRSPCTEEETGPVFSNPLYASSTTAERIRDPSFVHLAGIVGVPWQDLATDATLHSPSDLEFKTAEELTSSGIWNVILGNPSAGVPPTDPFMRESIEPRTGTNPITGNNLAPPESSPPWQNPINSHESLNPNGSDLQYACVFELLERRDCEAAAVAGRACECDPASLPETTENPLCQSPSGA